MNKNEFSSVDIIKLVSCLLFDIAIILGFFRILILFWIMSPIKAVVAFFILFTSLAILNGAIILPGLIYKDIGIPYTVSIVILSVLYFGLSNVPFIFFLSVATVWYVMYELIILSIFIAIFLVILLFSKSQIKYSKEFRIDNNDKKLTIKNEDN